MSAHSTTFAALAIAFSLALAPPAVRAQSSAAAESSAAPASTAAAAPVNAAPIFSAEARAAVDSDPVLQAMVAEIERSKTELKMDGVQAPYFIEYRVLDINGEAASAIFGALESDQKSRVRILRVVVRIGDYKQDSYFRNGQGVADLAPYENDILALRQ